MSTKHPSRRTTQIPTTWWGDDRHTRPKAELFASPDKVWPGLLLGLLISLIVYIPNGAQIPIQTGLRGVNVMNILFVMALGVMLAMNRPPSEPAPLKGPMLTFIGILSFALLVALVGDATAWVEDVTVYKNAIFYLLLYFLFYHGVRDARTVRILILAVMFVTFTSAVLGLRQAIDYGIGSFNENKRVSAPFGWSVYGANRSAVYFCVTLQLLAAMALFLKGRTWLRIACAGTFVLGVFVVFHTYSRQAYIIMAVLLLLLAMRKHLIVAVLAGVAVYHYDAWVPETVVHRIEMTQVDPITVRTPRYVQPTFDAPAVNAPLYGAVTDYGAGGSRAAASAEPGEAGGGEAPQYDESTESRFTLWSGAWELIQQRPWGIGLNRFKQEVRPYVPPNLAGLDAHNFYVLLTTEAGVVAPVILLVLLISLFMLGFRLIGLSDNTDADPGETRALGIGFVLMTLAAVLGNLFGSRLLDGEVLGTYWMVAGLVARAIQLQRDERLKRQRPASAPPPAQPVPSPSPAPRGPWTPPGWRGPAGRPAAARSANPSAHPSAHPPARSGGRHHEP